MDRKKLSSAVALAIVPLLAGVSAGQTINWQNSAGGYWTDPSNWTSQNVPDNTGENANIAAAGSYHVTLDQSESIGALSLNNSGAELDITGSNSFGGTGLTVGSLNIVAGTVDLIDQSSGYSTSLTVRTGGSFDNHGVLRVDAGNGGSRSITADLLNNSGGLVANVGFQLDASVYNTGTAAIAAGQTLEIAAGRNWTQGGGGAFGGTGAALRMLDGTFDFEGGTVDVPVLIEGQSAALKFGSALPANSGSGAFFVRTTANLLGSVPASKVVNIEGNGTFGAAAAIARSGDANAGTLNLMSTSSNYDSTLFLSANSTGTYTNNGTINFAGGTGGSRTVSGGLLINGAAGTLNVQLSADLNADLDNSGAIRIASGSTFTIGAGHDYTQRAGGFIDYDTTGAHTGAFVFNGNHFELQGGFVGPDVQLWTPGQTLAVTAASGNGTTFRMLASGSLTTSLPVSTTVLVQGNGSQGSLMLTVPDTFHNHGSINLFSTSSNYDAEIRSATPTGAITNDATMVFDVGTGGSRTLTAGSFVNSAGAGVGVNRDTTLAANVTNSGVINVANGATLTVGGSGRSVDLLSGSSLRNAPSSSGARLVMNDGTLHLRSGSTLAMPVDMPVPGTTLDMQQTDGGGTHYRFLASGSIAGSAWPLNATLDLEGNGSQGGIITLLPAATYTNRGTINLTSTSSNYYTDLQATTAAGGQGTTFYNNGVMNLNAGTGGTRFIDFSAGSAVDGMNFSSFFVQQGTLNLNQLTAFYGPLINLKTINLAADVPLFIQSGSNFSNASTDAVVNAGAGSYIEVEDNCVFNLSGGVIQAPVHFTGNNSTLRASVDAASGSGTAFTSYANTLFLLTDLGRNQSLRIEGNGSVGSAAVLAGDTFDNRGGLVLTSSSSNYDSGLFVGGAPGSVDGLGLGSFTNDGVIDIQKGTGGARHIYAVTLRNNGYLLARTDTELDATVINAGYIYVGPNRTLTVPVGYGFATATGGATYIASGGHLVIPSATSSLGVRYYLGNDGTISLNNASASGRYSGFALGSSATLFVAPGTTSKFRTGAALFGTFQAFFDSVGSIVDVGSGALGRTANGDSEDASMLGGVMTVRADRVTIGVGGELMPGDSIFVPSDDDAAVSAPTDFTPVPGIGTLTIDGELVLQSGSVYRANLSSTGHDSVAVTGNATLGGTLSFEVLNGSVPAARAKIDVVTVASGKAITGAFESVSGFDVGGGLRLGQAGPATFYVTVPGDATLDFTVGFDDLVVLAQHYNQTGNATWTTADFNYDGRVDFDDLVVLAQHYNSVAPGVNQLNGAGLDSSFLADWAIAQSLAPEPSVLIAFAGSAFLMARRQRRATPR